MGKTSLALLCLLGLALAHLSHAQNTPQDYLTAHNAARAEVGVQPMTWDKKLANYASQYVSEKLIGDCNLEHSGGPYGENLAAGGVADFDGADAVKMWVSEKPYYNYDSNSCVGGECGHYTQVVWNTSVNVGCARVLCKNGEWWIVSCNYDPPGNYFGERPYIKKGST